jgi:hypothetical protein
VTVAAAGVAAFAVVSGLAWAATAYDEPDRHHRAPVTPPVTRPVAPGVSPASPSQPQPQPHPHRQTPSEDDTPPDTHLLAQARADHDTGGSEQPSGGEHPTPPDGPQGTVTPSHPAAPPSHPGEPPAHHPSGPPKHGGGKGGRRCVLRLRLQAGHLIRIRVCV